MEAYTEFILLAQKGVTEGFIRGYFRGKGDNSLILNLEKEEIERESFKEVITEFLHPAEEILHLLVLESKEELFKESISALKKEGFVCEEKSKKKHSKMKAFFEVKIYDSKRGKEVKKLLTEQKEIKISFDRELKEIERDKKEKIELYAPEHSYELTGEGKIEGSVESVYLLVQKLRDLSVTVNNIRL